VAVAAFLDGLISWTAIADVLREVLDRHDGTKAESADVVIEVDRASRRAATQVIEKRTR
jgi:1-deoxy-D-xylulose 5-phosphate reductoisomerase